MWRLRFFTRRESNKLRLCTNLCAHHRSIDKEMKWRVALISADFATRLGSSFALETFSLHHLYILTSRRSSYKFVSSESFGLKMTKIKAFTRVLLSLMKSVTFFLLLWLLSGINCQIISNNKTSSIFVSATGQQQNKEEISFAFINNKLLEQNERYLHF